MAQHTQITISCLQAQSLTSRTWEPPLNTLQQQIITQKSQYRAFSTSRRVCKGKKNKIREDDGDISQSVKTKMEKAGNSNDKPVTDAVALVSLTTEISRIHDKLKKSLNELKPGGRFNPAWIEALRVDLSKLQARDSSNSADIKSDASNRNPKGANKDDSSAVKKSSRTIPLSELAQVIPRGGKTVLVMLNEEAFIKPVSSAILSSPYSLNPQASTTNPLELTVPIPAPSAETRKQTISSVDKFVERAELDLREARGSMLKTLRALKLERKIHVDSYNDVVKRMEKVAEEGKAEIKRLSDQSRKALQSG